MPFEGVNITEAWRDLQFLSNGFHPYNSQRNDAVRNWLLQRVDGILADTNATHDAVSGILAEKGSSGPSPAVTVFNDLASNLTFSQHPNGSPVVSTYFEGTNIIVYIRGALDPEGHWWALGEKPDHSGVLLNAHYDSVSTGFGTTDDGVGVVCMLQLLRYFSTSGQRPDKGMVLLFNNGEEDYLNGARAFARHPISNFPHSFLNFEGAGAGGRATLFRSTDAEVTSFYRGTEHPFGSALSGDAFKSGLIRSDTDYTVFFGNLGMHGLDVAFFEPRSMYHTEDDDTRHTNKDSLWHMLSMAIHTTAGLASDTDETFEGDGGSGHGQARARTGSDGVWFDLFGRSFVVFELHTLFAVSVTLLVVSPVVLIVTAIALSKADRLYLFSNTAKLHHAEGYEKVPLYGIRGFFRFPVASVASCGVVIGLASLLLKVNPYIVYSSPYAVWGMLMCAWIFVAWFFGRAANFLRPTAFHRSHAMVWLFLGGWVALVIATVYEERLHLAAGYFIVIDFFFISLAAWITFLEQFALLPKPAYAESLEVFLDSDDRRRESSVARSTRSRHRSVSPAQPANDGDEEDEEPSESTTLLPAPKRSTFANYTTSRTDTGVSGAAQSEIDEDPRFKDVYEYEQLWSEHMPSWTWLLQFLLLSVVPIIIIGQMGLLLASAGHQAMMDGGGALTAYLVLSLISIFLLARSSPFIHRFTYHVPLFLLAICVGATIYSLAAFPFSSTNRLKLFFLQRVNLDAGSNEVGISGMDSAFISKVIDTIPSAAGQSIKTSQSRRSDLVEHSWHGLPPNVVSGVPASVPPSLGYADWLHYNATRVPGKTEAVITVLGNNTRSCRLYFDTPIADFHVEGSDSDKRFPGIPDEGVQQIRLWRRDWDRGWNVTVRWNADGDRGPGLDGEVACLWNDEAGRVRVPALEEFRRFAPDWAVVSKLDDGLVEGSRRFTV